MALAANYKVGSGKPSAKKFFYSLNPHCVSGTYAFNTEDRHKVGDDDVGDGGTRDGTVVGAIVFETEYLLGDDSDDSD